LWIFRLDMHWNAQFESLELKPISKNPPVSLWFLETNLEKIVAFLLLIPLVCLVSKIQKLEFKKNKFRKKVTKFSLQKMGQKSSR
jgi:hypothetical protein